MIDIWYQWMGCLPFEWTHYVFMKNALLAVVLITPMFAVLGTMVISHRLVFFSDVLGHSALTGIAIGVLLGFSDPLGPMIILAIILAISVNLLRWLTHASSDTILGVFFASVVAFGIAILSRGGSFSKFANYLIGDILAVTPHQIALLAIMFLGVFIFWYFLGNALTLIGVNPVLARSRGINSFLVEMSFSILLAVVVVISIRLVGILIINSLLILPAASARVVSSNMKSYTFAAILLSLLSGIVGLMISYYGGTAAGATIVIVGSLCYAVVSLSSVIWKKR